jgi:proteasome lid subunit RPN8/RPN11
MAETIDNNFSPPEDSEEHEIKLGTFELPDPARTIIPTLLPVAASLLWEPKDLVATSEDAARPNPDVAIFVTQEVLSEVQQHLKSGGAHEHAGFLLGNRHRCPESGRGFVLIDNRVEAQYTQTTPLSVTFTFDTWARFKDELENKFRGKMAAGWYHSHPNLGVFLSPDDTGLHGQWFNQPFMSALVIDPIRCEGGFFAQREGRLLPSRPVAFYEILSRDEMENRRTQITWTNYRCRDPRTGKPFFPQPIGVSPDSTASNAKESNNLLADIPPPPPRLPWPAILAATTALIVLGTIFVFWPKRKTSTTQPTSTQAPVIAVSKVQKQPMSAQLGPFVSLPSIYAGPGAGSFYWVRLKVQAPSPWDGNLVATDWDHHNLPIKPDPRSIGTFFVGFRKDVLNALDKTSLRIRGVSIGDKDNRFLAVDLQYPEAGFAGRDLEKIAGVRSEAPVKVQASLKPEPPRPPAVTPSTPVMPPGQSSVVAPPASEKASPKNLSAPAEPVVSPAPGSVGTTGLSSEPSKESKQPVTSSLSLPINATPIVAPEKSNAPRNADVTFDLSTINGWKGKIYACNATAIMFEQCLGSQWTMLESILKKVEKDNGKGMKNRSKTKYEAAKTCLEDLNAYKKSKRSGDQQRLRATLHDHLDELHRLVIGN